jgi:hypothetical protein
MFDLAPSMYKRTHHNIIEFWYKTNFLQKIECDRIDIYLHEDEMSAFNSYSHYPNSKNRGFQNYFNWAKQGGKFKVYNKINHGNGSVFSKIKDNMKRNYQDVKEINCLLYNKHNTFSHLEMQSIGISSIQLDSATGYEILSGYFFKI